MRSAPARVLVAGIAMLAAAALPSRAPATRPYGGIGATVHAFETENPHIVGTPPIGLTDYQITGTHHGRVADYELTLNPRSNQAQHDLRRLLENNLPADARQVEKWKPAPDPGWYCAIYRSRWLGRVLYGPYVVLYESQAHQRGEANVSTQPACRG